MRKNRTPIIVSWIVVVVIVMAGLALPVGAADIYSDDFSGSGNLSGTAPDVRPGAETWTASTTAPAWQADGTITGNAHRNTWLPFTPVAGNVYTASLDVDPNAGADVTQWFALGFSGAPGTTNDFQNNSNNTNAWMLNRVQRAANGDLQTFLGPSTGGGVSHTTTAGVVNLQVVLDTQPANWEVEWYRDGSLIRGPVAYGSNPAINHVGFGRYGTAAGTVDNFNLATSFYVAPWTADETSGISADYDYTHALNMAGSAVNINGVHFAASGNSPSGSNFTWGGVTATINNDSNNVTGASATMANDFLYNGNPRTLTLTGLTAGKDYTATFYSVGWEAGGRNQTFAAGDAIHTIDQDQYGDNNGIRIAYDYTADATGSVAFTITPTGGTFHMYGFSNREAGPVVDNRSFELPDVSGWSYQSAIPGWDVSGSGKVGLTDDGGPWAGTGAIPDGTQAAFIQNSAGTTDTLSQDIRGLEVGETYRVSYRYNARSGYPAPNIKVTMGSAVLQDNAYNAVPGGSDPYYLGAYEFTAAATSATLLFENTDGTGDSAVVVDDVKIEPIATPGWTIAAWTGDGTSGVDASPPYTHAINLNSSVSPTIQTVTFKAAGTGADPTEGAGGANYSTLGMGSGVPNDANNLTGGGDGSAVMATAMRYGGDTSGITLNGLMPGVTYQTTIYGVAWDALPGNRNVAFSVNGSDAVTFNENQFDNNNGIRFTYRGTADANGTIAVSATALNTGNTWHYYGFSNNAVVSNKTIIGDAFAGHNGGDNGLAIDARGPDHANQPGAVTYVETGFNNAFQADVQNGTVQLGANAGAGISIADAVGYTKPQSFSVQADLKTGNLSGAAGGNARGVGLGFYDFSTDPGNVEVAIDFVGLVLAPDGSLYFYENQGGGQSFSASPVAFGGTFDTNAFYTLSYEVDTSTGDISDISLEGSTADYSSLATDAAGQFTDSATVMAAFTGSSAAGGTYGYVDNFTVTVPEPSTLILTALGLLGLLAWGRRRRR
jgi:hypothetical protein